MHQVSKFVYDHVFQDPLGCEDERWTLKLRLTSAAVAYGEDVWS
jgi:hypothetical protein